MPLIATWLGQGDIGDRPASPSIGADDIAFWWSIDTTEMSAYVDGAWEEDVFAGGGGLVDGDYGSVTVSGSGTVITIDNGAVTLAMQSDVATGTVFYRKTAGPGAPEVQTLATLKTDLGLTGTNSGDQTSIVGITGTKAEFDTACSDGNFLYVGDLTQYTDELAQDAVGTILVDSSTINLTYTDATPEITANVIAGSIGATELASTAVTPGTYNGANVTVDSDGRITAASSGYEAGPPTPPTNASLGTWDNQGTSTWTDGTNVGILAPQADGVIHGKYTAAPSTPYSVYCRVELMTLSTAASTTAIAIGGGVLFKDTGGDNERLLFRLGVERVSGDEVNTYYIDCLRYSGASPPVFSAQPFIVYSPVPWKWMKIDNDGTTLTAFVSHDGKNWFQVGTETLAAYIDGAASYGVAAYCPASATAGRALFSYFSTTAPS